MNWGKKTYRQDEHYVSLCVNAAWGFGDPHFRNLDGATFTFNGQGEYTMLRVAESGFVLQGRTEPVMSGNNQASRFTAFAFGLPDLNIVIEVRQV